jgi:hypothetical protein
MVCRKENECYQQARHRNSRADLDDALSLVVIGGQELVVKKAMEEMAYKNLKLALLLPWSDELGLNAERQDWMFGRSERGESFKHGGPP